MSVLTVKRKLSKDVKIFITQALSEFLNDPDFGLELSEKTKKRLRQANTSKEKPISFSEIKKKYY
ncbi:MAG: hypothetical protein AAB772_01285 [Patescibacteria group bacterium]